MKECSVVLRRLTSFEIKNRILIEEEIIKQMKECSVNVIKLTSSEITGILCPDKSNSSPLKKKSKEFFECDKCDEKFHSRNSLIKHFQSHDENDLECKICFLNFNSKYRLTEHREKNHTIKERFKCKFEGCGKDYSVEQSMKKHFEKFHGDRAAYEKVSR